MEGIMYAYMKSIYSLSLHFVLRNHSLFSLLLLFPL